MKTWQAKRIYWNTSSFFYKDKNFDTSGKLQVEVSTFNELLGRAYTEISATSRSMHKSQGFGSAPNYGKTIDYLEYLKGSRAEKDIFEGIDLSWNRVAGGKTVGKLTQKLVQQYDPQDPAASIPALLHLKTAVEKLPDNPYKAEKLAEIQELVKSCAGVFLEVTAAHYAATPGKKVEFTAIPENRSKASVS